jgi:hypothetical protein
MSETSNRPVLVVGATGGIGRLVVEELLRRGLSVRAMTRNISSSNADILRSLANRAEGGGTLYLVEGDVTKFPTVLSAMEGCGACISCHGDRRFTNPVKDLMFKIWDPTNEFLGAWGPSKPDPFPIEWGGDFSWLDPAADPAHPWNTAFYGVRNGSRRRGHDTPASRQQNHVSLLHVCPPT